MLSDILDGKCFKLVCGAGNEDAAEVEKLVALYYAAGCRFFDVSAKPEIVDAAKRALKGREAYICVSVGIKGDPHVNKARIDYENALAAVSVMKSVRRVRLSIIRLKQSAVSAAAGVQKSVQKVRFRIFHRKLTCGKSCRH